MLKYPVKPIPERIYKLRDELFKTQTKVCLERATIVTNSYINTEGEHAAVRRAKALSDIFNNISIFIRKGELLVGQRSEILGGQSIYPEYGVARGVIQDELWSYWRGKAVADMVLRAHPQAIKDASSEQAIRFPTGTYSGYGHVIVDYEKVINRGFEAVIEEAQELLKLTTEDDLEGCKFLESVIIACRGIISWAGRYADLAEKEAQEEPDERRRKELLDIADTCRHVPAKPARNFREALQSFWFIQIALHIEQNGWSISAGRFDQYIYPYYKNDIDSGAITHEEAWELLLSLWVKFMENVNEGVKYTVYQNLTLGGMDKDGKDQSNELSKLCLQATIALKFNQPALSVRWHPNIDPEFWDQVHHTIAHGLGLPALFNDEVIVKEMMSNGVDLEDALNYGLVGCVEPCVPGKQQGLTAGGHLNLAKALEFALNGGRSMITGKQIGLKTPEPSDLRCFEDLWKAYSNQVQYFAGLEVLAGHIAGEAQKQAGYCPLMSSVLDDCISRRQDLVYGGTRYNLPGM